MLSWGQPADIVKNLHGLWHLDRTVDDKATMTGTAEFTPNADNFVLYQERGQLRLADGQEFDSERSYLFREMTNGFAVFFAEKPPRLFHQIVLYANGQGELTGDATYSCGEDLYVSHYKFQPGFVFSIRHRVHGPRKNYCSDTLFRRMEDKPV